MLCLRCTGQLLRELKALWSVFLSVIIGQNIICELLILFTFYCGVK